MCTNMLVQKTQNVCLGAKASFLLCPLTYGAFSTYGEENPSESTTYGQHMGLFFKQLGFF